MNERNSKKDWGSNTRISLPVPPLSPKMVDVGGGFGFTQWGIAHDVSESDIEELSIPPYSPDGEF